MGWIFQKWLITGRTAKTQRWVQMIIQAPSKEKALEEIEGLFDIDTDPVAVDYWTSEEELKEVKQDVE